MALLRIEMDRGNGWELRGEGESPAGAAEIVRCLPEYAIQYPHRAFLDGMLVAEAAPARRRRVG